MRVCKTALPVLIWARFLLSLCFCSRCLSGSLHIPVISLVFQRCPHVARLYDGWAWVGQLDDSLERVKQRAKKIRRIGLFDLRDSASARKMQYGNDDAGRLQREKQQEYWQKQAFT